jgi:hypothetical protein
MLRGPNPRKPMNRAEPNETRNTISAPAYRFDILKSQITTNTVIAIKKRSMPCIDSERAERLIEKALKRR